MGQGPSSGKLLQRSTVKDVKDHLPYCLEEASKWEDGASLVHDLLSADIRGHPESLVSGVGSIPSSTADASQLSLHQYLAAPTASTGAARGQKENIEALPHSEEHAQQLDSASLHHLLNSVDEVLRASRGSDYFKMIPKEKLERVLTNPNSWFVLPPMGIERGQSCSRVFATAALQALLEEQESSRQNHHPAAGGGHGVSPQAHHKRLSSDVYADTAVDDSAKEKEDMPQHGERGGYYETEKEIRPVPISASHEKQVGGTNVPVQHTEPILGAQRGGEERGAQEQKIGQEAAPYSYVPLQGQASETGGVTIETLEHQRTIVAAKYLHVHRVLRLLTQQAEFNYKAAVRLSNLKSQFKQQKQFNALPPLQQLRVQKLAEENSSRLERGLIGFDRARLALGWLMQNYALAAASFKVNAAILQLRSLEREARGQKKPSAGLQSALRDSHMMELDKWHAWLGQRHSQLLIEHQANERDALGIGMVFLDASLSGYLEVAEVPDLSAKLFNLLGQSKNRISHDGLHECINTLANKLDGMQGRIDHLEVENESLRDIPSDHAVYTREKNRDEISTLTGNMSELKWELRNVYTYFHDQFVKHVFPRITPTAKLKDLSSVADTNFLISRLSTLETEARVNVLERELNLGKYNSTVMKQSAGTDAGVPSKAGETMQHGARGTAVPVGGTESATKELAPKESLKEKFLGAVRGKDEKARSPKEVEKRSITGHEKEAPTTDVIKDVQTVKPQQYGQQGHDEQLETVKLGDDEKKMPDALGIDALPIVSQTATGPVSQTKVPSVEEPSSRSPLMRFKDTARGLFSKHSGGHEHVPTTEKELHGTHQSIDTTGQDASMRQQERLPSTTRDVEVGRESEPPSSFHKADTRSRVSSPIDERGVDTGEHDMAEPERGVTHEHETQSTEVPVTRQHHPGFLQQLSERFS